MESNFDLEAYLDFQKSMPDLLRQSTFYDPKEIYTVDGVFKPEIYKSEKLKILIIGSESYGAQSISTNIKWHSAPDELETIGRIIKNVPSLNNVSKLLWLLGQQHVAERTLFPQNKRLDEALFKSAWINLKKASGKHSKQNGNQILRYANEHKQILSKQIELIAPNLIIVLGDAAINGVFDNQLFGHQQVFDKRKKSEVQIMTNGQSIILLSHPAARNGDWKNSKIIEYYNTIHAHFNG